MMTMAERMRSQMDAALSHLGIGAISERSRVDQTVADVMAAHGLEGVVTELRWGTLIVSAPPGDAASVRFLKDVLLEAVREQGGAVDRVVIRADGYGPRRDGANTSNADVT